MKLKRKRCTGVDGCGKLRLVSKFSKDANSPDGLCHRCVACQKKYKHKWDKKHLKARAAYLNQYRIDHPGVNRCWRHIEALRRRGLLKLGKCKCGRRATHAHHPDHRSWRRIKQMCNICHNKLRAA